MKFKNKRQLKLVLTLLFLLHTTKTAETPPPTTDQPVTDEANQTNPDDPNNPSPPPGPSCKAGAVEILEIPDAKTLPTPSIEPLEICPHVKFSCCDPVDAKKLADNWGKVAQPRIKEVLSGQKKIYDELLEVLVQVDLKAAGILAIEGLLDNNCKIMARNIYNHELKKTSEQIKQIVEEFHVMLEDIYRSTYCTLCDAESHNFFDPEKKEIKINFETCREIGNRSLKFLLYFHVNVVSVLNLANFFANTCDHKAAYNAKKVPKEHLFTINGENATKLKTAIETRNDSDWMKAFTRICNDLKIGELTKFFMPYVKEFEEYTVYLKGVLAGPKLEEKKEVAKEGEKKEETTPQESSSGRILVDNPPADGTSEGKADEGGDQTPAEGNTEGATEEKPKPEVLTPYDPLKIYHKDNSKSVGIDAVRTVVEEEGIDMLEVGRSVVFGAARGLRGKRRREKRVKKRRKGGFSGVGKKRRRKLRRLKSGWRVVGTILGLFVVLIM